MSSGRSILDETRRRDAVETRHEDVDQKDGEVVEKEMLEGLLPGRRAHQPTIEREKDGLEREEIGLDVVDDENARAGRQHGKFRTLAL
jgi:hypothetical protein